MLNTEKQETPNQNNENRNTTHPNTRKQTLTQDDKINVELMKKIMTSFRNQDWKKVKVETEKKNKLLPNIAMDNIAELNKLIYRETTLIRDKSDALIRKLNRNAKLG